MIYIGFQENYKIIIGEDVSPMNPREASNESKMVCFHKKFKLGDIHSLDLDEASVLERRLKKKPDKVAILPLYLLNHSGISISTYPYSNFYDSGKIGFIYKDIPLGSDLESETASLREEIETYNRYLQETAWEINLYEFDTLLATSSSIYEEPEVIMKDLGNYLELPLKEVEFIKVSAAC